MVIFYAFLSFLFPLVDIDVIPVGTDLVKVWGVESELFLMIDDQGQMRGTVSCRLYFTFFYVALDICTHGGERNQGHYLLFPLRLHSNVVACSTKTMALTQPDAERLERRGVFKIRKKNHRYFCGYFVAPCCFFELRLLFHLCGKNH